MSFWRPTQLSKNNNNNLVYVLCNEKFTMEIKLRVTHPNNLIKYAKCYNLSVIEVIISL